jgi:hypothetical protein
MNQLSIHDIKSIKINLPEKRSTDLGEESEEWSIRHLEITTKKDTFLIRLYGDTIEDIKISMDL